MGFLSKLFSAGEEPERFVSDQVLGQMEWSQDDGAWIGEYNGFKFGLAYEREKRVLVDPLVAYAREILNDPAWLASTLAAAKAAARKEYGKFYEAEIDGLSFGLIDFYLFRGKRRIIASLEGGRDYRCWRIEYADRTCEGIGFDS